MTNTNLQARNNEGLSFEQMLKVCPSIFATAQHDSRSNQYEFVSTLKILEKMKQESFYPVKVQQSRSRIPGKSEFTKHMIRFREGKDLGNVVGSDVHEIVLINSHDGTSSYNITDGVFRVVCTNGLVTCLEEKANYKVLHKGNIQDDIIEASYRIIEDGKDTMRTLSEMKGIQLSRPEQLLLSEFSLKAKYGVDEEDEDKKQDIPFSPDNFLRVRRNEDRKSDLYTTYNVIQENMIKGGITTRDKNYKRHTSRAVNSIDKDVKLNKMLWAFANEMMKLKTS